MASLSSTATNAASMRFEKLAEPFQIGSMQLRNRFVMPPMGTNFADKDGFVTDEMIGYYEARARGGAGLIVVEIGSVDLKTGKAIIGQLSADDDRYIPGLSKLAAAIHRHGAKIALQIQHGGRGANPKFTGKPPVGPSAIIGGAPRAGLPRELSIAEIQDMIRLFANTAVRARSAGFDGVEIHACHGYLLANFLSATSNQRQDEYGGSVENRARILTEIIKAARQATGGSYPVWCRINGKEYGIERGITLDESKQIAGLAEKAGADAISVSAFGSGSITRALRAIMARNPGELLHLAAGIKESVSVPVIAVGKMTPQLAEEALSMGKADLIAFGRGLICDADLPNKVAAGKLDEIRPCINCLRCLHRVGGIGLPLGCSVNAAIGREGEAGLAAKRPGKKVLVVGGGPAGMEAARMAASRGHQVRLMEKEGALGGQLLPAAASAGKRPDIAPFTEWLAAQVHQQGVKVDLNVEATPETIRELNPDVVVLAAGITPNIPDIPGLQASRTASANDVLTGKANVGYVVAVIGGELVGCETAEFLVDQGKTVTMIRRGPEMAANVITVVRQDLLDRLARKGVHFLPGVKWLSIEDGKLTLFDQSGEKRVLEVDSVVLATGGKPNVALRDQLKGAKPEVYLVGDAVEPRGIMEAIADGFRVGSSI